MASDVESESDALTAIRYNGGSLEVLDQRKLPHEIVYKTIESATDGWRAIHRMMGRGIPANTVVAALSLAVEVASVETWLGTSRSAASFIESNLDYLLSSQPTALTIPCLAEAAKKLNEVASNAVASGKAPLDVFQACIEVAQVMLEDDIASNKAIAFHGETFLRVQLKNHKKFSVLTQCNVGSLASAEYGTVHGILPELHRLGVLKMAYYTETHPFYQDSMLTAFRRVDEKIPATLIADSAVAALMKEEGRVNAVIVAVDRIAANGDTANKIGTYSLASCAKFHKIPFFVAAPIASIDLSRSTGKELYIEDGTLGKLTIASKIELWNPAFDVTSYKLIDGIITDKGFVKKRSTAFYLKEFIEQVTGQSTT